MQPCEHRERLEEGHAHIHDMLFVGIVVLQNSAKMLMLSILFMFMHGYVQSGAQIDIKSINL